MGGLAHLLAARLGNLSAAHARERCQLRPKRISTPKRNGFRVKPTCGWRIVISPIIRWNFLRMAK
jgi:hypothetical protein